MGIKLLLIILVAVLGLLSAMGVGTVLWHRATEDLIDELNLAPQQKPDAVVDFKELEKLPAPVKRYFRHVLKDGQPFIRSARLVQEGGFRAGAADGRWSGMKATQYYATLNRGFVWDARIRMAPLVFVRVRDAYLGGRGRMQARLLSILPVMDEQARPELNAGALQRYLAEAAWFPTALFPGQGVRWSGIDANRAVAELTDSGITVSLEFRFNDRGEITRVFTTGRYREADGKYVPTPWAGYFRDYQEHGGMLVPAVGTVEWHLPGGKFPYWKARIVEFTYSFYEGPD